MTLYCDDCGAPMKKVGDIQNTRQFICVECFAEKVQFIKEKPCEHDYDDRNYNKCIHCGEPSIHLK